MILKYGETEQEFKGIAQKVHDITDRQNGRMLNGNGYSHLRAVWREWDIVISANETINSTKNTFLRNFWKTPESKYFKVNSGDDFIEVIINGGEPPIEDIEGNKYLPEYKLRLIEKAGAV